MNSRTIRPIKVDFHKPAFLLIPNQFISPPQNSRQMPKMAILFEAEVTFSEVKRCQLFQKSSLWTDQCRLFNKKELPKAEIHSKKISTLPETSSSPLKIGLNAQFWKLPVAFQSSIFRCKLAVSFREGANYLRTSFGGCIIHRHQLFQMGSGDLLTGQVPTQTPCNSPHGQSTNPPPEIRPF